MINKKWVIKVDQSTIDRIEDFLLAFGYDVFTIGDIRNGEIYYFYNPNTDICIKFGKVRSIQSSFVLDSFKEYSSLEELIDLHFTER